MKFDCVKFLGLEIRIREEEEEGLEMTYQTGPMSVPLSVRLFVWCQWFKKPKAPRPLGQGQRNLACVFYGSEDRTSRKQNFEFWHLHCAGLCQT